MKVTLNKQTSGGYFPETVNVESITWGFESKTAVLHVDPEEFTEKFQAVAFAQMYAVRISFTSSTIDVEVKGEYIADVYFS